MERSKKENWKEEMIKVQILLFIRDSWGLLTRCGRVWLSIDSGVRQILLEEVHKSKFSIHPGATKMYSDPRLSY